MTHWHALAPIEAAKLAGVPYEVYPAWDQVNPYGKKAGWNDQQASPVGLIWHHTGCGATSTSDYPSLLFCINGSNIFKGEARSCNALMDRTGKLHFISAYACYHAGTGGPIKLNGHTVPKDVGNRWLYGVEIEAHSSGTVVPYKKGDMNGLTKEQFQNMSKWCAALADLQGWETTAFIRHKDYTDGSFDGDGDGKTNENPTLGTKGRKVDVLLPLSTIRTAITAYRGTFNKPTTVKPTTVPPVTQGASTPGKLQPLPLVSAKAFTLGAKNDSVLTVQKALAKEVGLDYSTGPGTYGPKTATAWFRYTRKHPSLPRRELLTLLGKKHGFTVVA